MTATLCNCNMYVGIYICMPVCMYGCVHMLQECINVGMCIGRHTRVCMCMHISVYIFKHVCMYVDRHVSMYVYTYAYCMDPCTHTCVCK